jgi:hypothetical protein
MGAPRETKAVRVNTVIANTGVAINTTITRTMSRV